MLKHIHSEKEFSAFISEGSGVTVVDFFANWCGPCQQIAPYYESLAAKFPTVRFAKVDVDQCPSVAASQNVTAMPTFMIYVDKVKVDSVRGANITEVEEKIKKWLSSASYSGGNTVGLKKQDNQEDMWFKGQVAHAIAKAKHENSLLVIFVHGSDDKSKSMLDAWQSSEVRSLSLQNNCVALKFDGSSIEAKQFSEFYPLVSIPASFLIDTNGKPLEIIVDNISSEELIVRLGKALSTGAFKQSKNSAVQSAANAASSNSLPVERSPPGMDKTQQLLQEMHEKKAKKELEDEKGKELKRRDEGKTFAEVRERQRELEILAAAEEKKQTKKADREYLQRLRDQIAADRAEKSATFKAVKATEDEAKHKKKEEDAQRLNAERDKLAENYEESCKIAKIQFRLGDGSHFNKSFDSHLHFGEARKFINDTLNLNDKFQLIQMYPRREFAQADYARSFQELDLAPSAVVMVLQDGKMNSGPVRRYKGSWIWPILATITYPFFSVFGWIYAFVFPQPPPRPATSSTSANETRAEFGRQDGNIRRMPEQGSSSKSANNRDDDDNATWNGNSTQQL